MLGFTDNPYPYFKNADFYILSSRYEGFPTVLFEAITLKKKIISTEVSGANEMLNNGNWVSLWKILKKEFITE
jgi:glycosyltransferase involved in cell wall biosynthesis